MTISPGGIFGGSLALQAGQGIAGAPHMQARGDAPKSDGRRECASQTQNVSSQRSHFGDIPIAPPNPAAHARSLRGRSSLSTKAQVRLNLRAMGSRDALIYDVAATDSCGRQKPRPSSGRPGLTFGARDMSGFWMSVVAAQKSAATNKPANRRYYVFQILGGIAIALLIGGALLIAATFNG